MQKPKHCKQDIDCSAEMSRDFDPWVQLAKAPRAQDLHGDPCWLQEEEKE